MVTNFKIFENMKQSEAEIEFYKKIQDTNIYNEIKKFIDNEILPYCKNNTIMNIFNDFKNFGKPLKSTTIKNLKTTEYRVRFTPSKYYDEKNGGWLGIISYFIVQDNVSNDIIDSYFEIKISGFSYKEMTEKQETSFTSTITDIQLTQLLKNSKLSSDDKLEFYIDQIDVDILKKTIIKIGINKFNGFEISASDTDSEVRELVKFWLYEDSTYSDPLKKAILYQAKKLGIVI